MSGVKVALGKKEFDPIALTKRPLSLLLITKYHCNKEQYLIAAHFMYHLESFQTSVWTCPNSKLALQIPLQNAMLIIQDQ